jgi:YHS domain-containing protein
MDKKVQFSLVAAAWFAAFSVAVFGYLAWQRGLPGADGADGAAAVAGATAVCPVTGRTVAVGPDTPKVVYLGRTYYFSGDKDADGHDARTRFLMDPESFVKPQPAAP